MVEAFHIYLQQFPLYTPGIYEQMIPFLSQVRLEVGDYFLPLGAVCRKIAFVEEGLFRHYYLRDGKEVTNCFCKEHTLTTSYRSLITQNESDIAIQAIEPSLLTVFQYDTLQRLYEADPFWQQVGRLAAEDQFITTERHNRFITDLTATERYEHIMATDKELLFRVPLQYLASYLQITPETLSRIRSKMTEK